MYVPRSAAHCLISAPTETGKSRRILTPAATLWGGPAVVVSSKDDLMQLVMERRWGPKALIDLRPLRSPVYPDGLVPNIYDPTVTIDSPYEALTLAETIMQMSTVGLGSGADQVSDGGVWESQAAGPLAAFLYAASPSPHCNGLGMDWVLKGVDNIDPKRISEPGWAQAAATCSEFPTIALGMRAIMEMDPRQRDSVAITMRKAITPWLRTSLLSRPAAVPFTPDFLDDPQATLFVLAPADGTVAGAAVTLLDSFVRRWTEKTSTRETMHRLLMVVDELPNTAPIPNLRKYVGEGRGLGINLMAAVQSSSQLDTVYGRDYADELRDIFPASLIMYGAREEQLLTAAENWSPLTTRRPQGFHQADGHKNLNSDLGAMLRWQELLPQTPSHARLLIRGGVGVSVEIPDWSVFKHMYDQVTAAYLAKTGMKSLSPEDPRAADMAARISRVARRLWVAPEDPNRWDS
ncbi:MAG: type IV secretory system conjugative DNA transfer family protein [Actinomycetia bacterium]|nr:type IV secretory system conjugative DNA transfer family protein [Actinomycetes bacterium]